MLLLSRNTKWGGFIPQEVVETKTGVKRLLDLHS